MVSAADLASELDEGLRQLFQAGLELSLQVRADAMQAESAEERARLSLTFHRLSRGVRQTAALRMKLARDAELSRRETAAEVIQLDKRRLAKRKAYVKSTVEGLIWTEAERDDHDSLNADLEDVLDIETQDAESFEAEPLDAQIARLCQVIGLKDPPPQGLVSPQVTEGVAAHSPNRPASQPPQSLRDSSPSGGASDDPMLSDDYWRSSA